MNAEKHNGDTIRLLAESKGVSVKELSEKMNVTRQAVYEVFRRDNVKFSTVMKFYQALGVSQVDVENFENNHIKEKLTFIEENDKEYLRTIITQQAKALVEKERQLSEQTATIAQLAQSNHALIVQLGKFQASEMLAVAYA
ncbi:hypothetical protein [Spirosoma areae]